MAQPQVARITCSQCNGWYNSERELRDHMQVAHRRFAPEQSTLQHGSTETPHEMLTTHPGRGHPDRRSAPRYLLSLPIAARVAQKAEPVAGISRDVSIRGVYFTADLEFTPGSVLDLSFTLPAEITEGTEVFVLAQGRVVRVERETDAQRVGVAMVIEKYEIVRAKPNLHGTI
jgi:hypothetical protein